MNQGPRRCTLRNLLIGFDQTKRKDFKYLATHLEEAILKASPSLNIEERQKKARSLAKCLKDRVTSKMWKKKSWANFLQDPTMSIWLDKLALNLALEEPANEEPMDGEDEVPAAAAQEDEQVAGSHEGWGRSASPDGEEPPDFQPAEFM